MFCLPNAYWRRLPSCITFAVILSACGGGGGGGDDNDRVTDTTPPTVTAVSPANGANDVATDTTLRVTFSEALLASSVTQTSVTLTDGAANVPAGLTLSGNAITVTPNQALAETTTFTANVASTVTDLAGNRLRADYVWSFTTGDFTAPSVTATSPADGEDNTAIDQLVVATVSEPLAPASVGANAMTLTAGGMPVAGTVSLGAGATTVIFTPDEILNTLTNYEATLDDSVTDPAGNALDQVTNWNFRTSLAGTLSAAFASSEGTVVLRRVDAYEDRVVGRDLLSDPAWTGFEANSIRLSPDGSMVAFRADETVADPAAGDELYVVSVEGGTPLKVSGSLVAGGSVWTAAWSPDGSRLAYIADKDTDGINELYVVAADGTGTAKLITAAGPEESLDESFLAWSPNGTYIAVATSSAAVPDQALRIVPSAGGAVVEISGSSSVELDPDTRPRFSPDGTRIAYANPQDLIVNDLTGASEVVVTPPAAISVDGFAWLSDSARLVWHGLASAGIVPRALHVCGTASDSCNAVTANEVYEFAPAPDDSLIAFTADAGANSALYVVAPDGTGETIVSLAPATALEVRTSTRPVWAPDSSGILYAERLNGAVSWEVHLTSPDGASNTTLSDIEGSADELEDFTFSPDGSQVVYGAFAGTGLIYRVNLDGTGRTELTDSAGGDDGRSYAVRDDAGSVNGLQLAP